MKKILPILVLAVATFPLTSNAQHTAHDNMAGKSDKMDMMGKMMSGMSAKDKAEMKVKMDKMMALPPAERMKSMQGMCDAGMMNKMMGGMPDSGKSEMKMKMDKMKAMPPADRMKTMKMMCNMGDMGKMNGMGKMGGMARMDDKMMSGLSVTDKSDMKMMMDRMMAMPPADRMKAMHQASGMGSMGGMESGMMGGMMSGMSTADKNKMMTMMDKMMAMSPADRMAAMHKMSGMGMMDGMQGHDKGMQMPVMKMGMSGVHALKGLTGKEYNIAFLSQMIAHHQGAVDMAQQTLKIAKHAETKKEAYMVVENQTKEIRQMTAWLQKWYGVKPSKKHIDLMRADMSSMSGMKIEDDSMFYTMMIPHHQGAIDMSQLSAKQSDKTEVRQLSMDIIKAQKSEISRYTRLLKE